MPAARITSPIVGRPCAISAASPSGVEGAGPLPWARRGDAAGNDSIVRRVSAAEIEAAVVDQVRALLRQPEIVVGTWRAARREAPDLTEGETQDALRWLDPLWEHLFPAEQARIVRSLVERVVVGPAGADIRLRQDGLGGLVRDLIAIRPDDLKRSDQPRWRSRPAAGSCPHGTPRHSGRRLPATPIAPASPLCRW